MIKIFRKILNRLTIIFMPKVINQVIKSRLSFLEPLALYEIFKTIDQLEKNKIEGQFIEAGCALGGSAIVIAKAKKPTRPFFVYDVFDMIPPPSEMDEDDAHTRYEIIAGGEAKGIKENAYYGYEQDLLYKVKKSFLEFGIDFQNEQIHLIKGLFRDTLRVNSEVAFAHIDADWHDSVMYCLEQIEPYLVSGAVLIIDDYQDWVGCKKAVDAYFEDKHDDYEFVEQSRLHIIHK